ncbi:pheromone A receptor-domain-containing protein [Gloeopeniophorella convolvens]|nr:pheromone A receptor-domain-containing protein [Gloeopeniophorella convolvens]
MSYPNQIFSAFAFIGFLLCAIPFYWHLEAWNTGTCLYMAWVGLGCLNAFINSVVWNSTVLNVAPVWCDISTRFMIGLSVAVPTASLVINRRLFKIASVKAAFSTREERRRAVLVDLAIGLGIPLLQMVLQIIVEGHRFDIFEQVGCFPFTYDVTLAYPLSLVWPIVIGLVSLVYSSLTIRLFWRSSRQFNEVLASKWNPSRNRYLRLMALSMTEILLTLPIASYSLYLNTQVAVVQPWISWDDTHFDYSRIGQFPTVIWRASATQTVGMELSRWLVVVCAFIFFAFFGFADEARRHYRLAVSFASSRLGFSRTGSGGSGMAHSAGSSSFGPGFRKGLGTFGSAKGAGAGGLLGPGSRPEMRHKASSSLESGSSRSEFRLTSDLSIFGGIDDQLKAMGIAAEDDGAHRAPAHLPVAVVLPRRAESPGVPPGRLDAPLPHRPASFFNSSDKV